MTEYLERDDGSKMPVGTFISKAVAAKRKLAEAKQRYKEDPTPKNRAAVALASQKYEEAIVEEARA